MNKIHPKTKYLGQTELYLTECHSTNDLAAKDIKENGLTNGKLYRTDYQTKGRGQLGSVWKSEPGLNILASVVLADFELAVSNQFEISMRVAIGIKNAIASFLNLNCAIKWPNDLYFNNKKLGGILIENAIKGQKIKYSIVGFGINVNQEIFDGPRATSLKNITGHPIDLLGLLASILAEIECLAGSKDLKEMYLASLMGYHQNLKYQIGDKTIKGVLKDISSNGHAMIEINDRLKAFDIKEIAMILN